MPRPRIREARADEVVGPGFSALTGPEGGVDEHDTGDGAGGGREAAARRAEAAAGCGRSLIAVAAVVGADAGDRDHRPRRRTSRRSCSRRRRPCWPSSRRIPALFLRAAAVTLGEAAAGLVLGAAAALAFAAAATHSRRLDAALTPAGRRVPDHPRHRAGAVAGPVDGVRGAAARRHLRAHRLLPHGRRGARGPARDRPDLLLLMRSAGARRRDVFWRVRVPAAAPYLAAGLRTGITLSLVGAVVAEWTGAGSGLGYLVLSRERPAGHRPGVRRRARHHVSGPAGLRRRRARGAAPVLVGPLRLVVLHERKAMTPVAASQPRSPARRGDGAAAAAVTLLAVAAALLAPGRVRRRPAGRDRLVRRRRLLGRRLRRARAGRRHAHHGLGALGARHPGGRRPGAGLLRGPRTHRAPAGAGRAPPTWSSSSPPARRSSACTTRRTR